MSHTIFILHSGAQTFLFGVFTDGCFRLDSSPRQFRGTTFSRYSFRSYFGHPDT